MYLYSASFRFSPVGFVVFDCFEISFVSSGCVVAGCCVPLLVAFLLDIIGRVHPCRCSKLDLACYFRRRNDFLASENSSTFTDKPAKDAF